MVYGFKIIDELILDREIEIERTIILDAPDLLGPMFDRRVDIIDKSVMPFLCEITKKCLG